MPTDQRQQGGRRESDPPSPAEIEAEWDATAPVPPCPDCGDDFGAWQEGRFGEVWEPCPTCQPTSGEWWEITEGEKP